MTPELAVCLADWRANQEKLKGKNVTEGAKVSAPSQGLAVGRGRDRRREARAAIEEPQAKRPELDVPAPFEP